MVLGPLVGFLKPLYVSLVDDKAQFGMYTLVIAYAVWFGYVLNSGIYEGLLKRYAIHNDLGNFKFINLIDQKIRSFWFMVLFICIVFCSLLSSISGNFFIFAGILLSFSIVSFNVYTARLRIESRIFKISLLQLFRLVSSLAITYLLLSFTDMGLDKILYWDAFLLCLINLTIFFPRFSLKFLNKKFFKLYQAISMSAISLTYISGLKTLFLLMERQLAGMLFNDETFSRYSQILLLFQAGVVLFGLVPQMWQQNIIQKTLKDGFEKIIRLQIHFIILLFILWTIFMFLAQSFVDNIIFDDIFLSIYFVGSAGIIYGSFFFDSILIGVKNLQGIINVYIKCAITWIIFFSFFRHFIQDWSLVHQSILLFALSFILLIFPTIYIYSKNKVNLNANI